MPAASAADRAAREVDIRERQIGRMPLVGCTPENAPLIEQSYRDTLMALDAAVGDRPFLFGSRPSLADFGLYGMMMQLGTDPTPADLMREEAPNVPPWLRRLDDASGVAGEWDAGTLGSAPVRDLLRVVAQVYLPFLAANAAALADDAETVEVSLQGHAYRQAPFKYQAKCLAALQAGYADLPVDARETVAGLIADEAATAILAGT